jgi:hypothetical protein
MWRIFFDDVCVCYVRLSLLSVYDQCANSVIVYMQQHTRLPMFLVRPKHVMY